MTTYRQIAASGSTERPTHPGKGSTVRIALLAIQAVALLLLASGCCSYSKMRVHLIPDNEWHDVYENRGGEIQRILVTKQTVCSRS